MIKFGKNQLWIVKPFKRKPQREPNKNEESYYSPLKGLQPGVMPG
jgi:hypothetical protein